MQHHNLLRGKGLHGPLQEQHTRVYLPSCFLAGLAEYLPTSLRPRVPQARETLRSLERLQNPSSLMLTWLRSRRLS